ncbi:MAG: hypothetical protein ACE5H1_00305 [Thermodesulfobacteriota bacterium]
MPTPIKEEWKIRKEKDRPTFLIDQVITARWNAGELLAQIQGWEKQIEQKKQFEHLMKKFTEAEVEEIDLKGNVLGKLPDGARELARKMLGMDSSPEKKGEPTGLPAPTPYEPKTAAPEQAPQEATKTEATSPEAPAPKDEPAAKA